jgi:hypothetical protein
VDVGELLSPYSLTELVTEGDVILLGTVAEVERRYVEPTEIPLPQMEPDENLGLPGQTAVVFRVQVDDLIKDEPGLVNEAPFVLVNVLGVYEPDDPDGYDPQPGEQRLWFLREWPGHPELILSPPQTGMLRLDSGVVEWPINSSPVEFAEGMTPSEFVDAVRAEVDGE